MILNEIVGIVDRLLERASVYTMYQRTGFLVLLQLKRKRGGCLKFVRREVCDDWVWCQSYF